MAMTLACHTAGQSTIPASSNLTFFLLLGINERIKIEPKVIDGTS